MAVYGLKVWDSSGNIVLDTSDKVFRLRYSTTATANNDGNVTLSDISGKTIALASLTLTGNSCPHYVYRDSSDDTIIKWEANGFVYAVPHSGDSLILVFLRD